ncbi:ABC transporter permease [Polymorphospora rubra]|uniref:ABC transporter permease n=1 Tax=Polymorphospora rubra TaxID=338584 RepID=UPI003F4CC67E
MSDYEKRLIEVFLADVRASLPAPNGGDPAVSIEPGTSGSESAEASESSPQVAVDGHPGSKVANEQPVEPAAAGLEEAPKPAPEPAPESAPDPGPKITPEDRRRLASWPVWLIALPAAVAIWGGWVGLGGLTGFGYINLLPGIVADGSWATINSAITLPIGVEAYAAYALRAWLSGRVPDRARRFARWSAIASLLVGALGQVAYHVLVAAGITAAPWWITTLVACLPVTVLGMAATLAHLIREGEVR